MDFFDAVNERYQQAESDNESVPGRWTTEMTIALGDWSHLNIREEDLAETLNNKGLETQLATILWSEIRGTATNDVLQIPLTGLEVKVIEYPSVGSLKNAQVKIFVELEFEMMDEPVHAYINRLATKFVKNWAREENVA